MKCSYNTLLSTARRKGCPANQGFTLIELLVSVIIIGVLAAIALPNLLTQVGKARDTELRNTVGTITRAQHAYHFETRAFTNNMADLGVTISTQYQTTPGLGTDTTTYATVRTNAPGATTNATRAFASRLEYNTIVADYDSIFCSSLLPANNMPAPVDTANCPSGSTQVR